MRFYVGSQIYCRTADTVKKPRRSRQAELAGRSVHPPKNQRMLP